MTILELKTAIASYHHRVLADLTVNGQDLGLLALNQVRKNAELMHDFNFNRKLLTLNVDTVTGGSLDNAVLVGTATTAEIKTLLDVGTFDDFNNFIPQEWTSVEESLDRQREENRFRDIRYPTDAQITNSPCGWRRYTLANNTLYSWPKTETSQTLATGLWADVFTADWTGTTTVTVSGATGITDYNDTYYLVGNYGATGLGLWLNSNPLTGSTPLNNVLRAIWSDGAGDWYISEAKTMSSLGAVDFAQVTSSNTTPAGLTFAGFTGLGGTIVTSALGGTLTAANDVWTKHGSQYLQWAAIDELNRYFKTYVPRQEGNLTSPTDLAQAGLEAFKQWDIFKYEGHRRHGR